MAGIYIHIPFCKQACRYCNFYFSTSPANRDKFLDALLREIDLSRDYLQGEKVETIYLGGGTPSLMPADEIKKIVDRIGRHHDVAGLREFTIEANPDDLNAPAMKEFSTLKEYGLNRFSIGIQSFFDADLQYMNRAHTSQEALAAVKRTQDAGFEKITIDLIYGTPTLNNDRWKQNLQTAFSLKVPHISSYLLTVEPKTALYHDIKKGKAKPVNEEQAAGQFRIMVQEMKSASFEQYEISNFAQAGQYAIHNTNYWKGQKYLGLGPSAHSFNGVSRRWNVANNVNYMEVIGKREIPFEEELLTESQRVNEKIMTSLRTIWGLDLSELKPEAAAEINRELAVVNRNWYRTEGTVIILTDEGKLFADHIAATLFVSDEREK